MTPEDIGRALGIGPGDYRIAVALLNIGATENRRDRDRALPSFEG
jgi:hypothetical protein